MSDPKEQRADGCGIFLTIIIVVIVSLSFIFIQKFLQPDEPSDTSLMTDEQRAAKIEEFHQSNEIYNQNILNYHAEKNSSLEDAMVKILTDYGSDVNQTN
tara:strand:+ start:260 stop:559 length:300 start_codon:yes stop_codon:yes gene_type:complete